MPTSAKEKDRPLARSILTFGRRLILVAYWIVGGIANVLGIYGYGESHHWWTFKWTPKWTFTWPLTLGRPFNQKEELLMLAVGLAGPWALMLGGIVGTKLSEFITHDRTITSAAIQSFIKVGFFFALFHCAEVNFGIRIFPRYLSGDGIAKIFVIYLSLGLSLGAVLVPILNVLITTLRARLRRQKRSSAT